MFHEVKQEAQMTGAFERERFSSGCSCGRCPPPQQIPRRRAKGLVEHDELVGSLGQASEFGKLDSDPGTGMHTVRFAGSCIQPITKRVIAKTGALFVRYEVRCRRCGPCRKARMFYWAMCALERTEAALARGRRTWFGTLTLTAGNQAALLETAREKWLEQNASGTVIPDWWDNPHCDTRFELVRAELVAEVQGYWKRLRATGLRFKYFLVFERHKSGLPHIHWLLHEEDAPILKRELQAKWDLGFTKVKLVGGKTKGKRLTPQKAAFYVAKYLHKSSRTRQIASRGYDLNKKTLNKSQ